MARLDDWHSEIVIAEGKVNSIRSIQKQTNDQTSNGKRKVTGENNGGKYDMKTRETIIQRVTVQGQQVEASRWARRNTRCCR